MAIETWGCGGRHIQLLLLGICAIIERCLQMSVCTSIYLVRAENANNYTLFDDPYRQVVKGWTITKMLIACNMWLMQGFTASAISGYLTMKFNLKWFLLINMAVLTLVVYAFPHITVYGNYNYVLATTSFMGFLHGLIEPNFIGLLALWTPRCELGRSVPLILTASFLSPIFMFTLYNFLRYSPAAWVSLFYLIGNTGVLWCVAWYTFGSQTPDSSFLVPLREKSFIMSNMRIASHKKLSIPWVIIFTSPQFYGVLAANVAFQWIYRLMYWSIFFQSYTYSRGLSYDVTLYSAYFLNSVAVPLLQFGVGSITDHYTNKGKHPTRYLRKTFNSIALWGGSILLLFDAYDGTPLVFQVIVLSIFAHIGAMFYQGGQLTFFDLDRAYSGLIYGLVQFFSLIPLAFINSLYPLLLQALKAPDPAIKAKFDQLWIVGSNVLFFGNFFYVIMADDETIPIVPFANSP